MALEIQVQKKIDEIYAESWAVASLIEEKLAKAGYLVDNYEIRSYLKSEKLPIFKRKSIIRILVKHFYNDGITTPEDIASKVSGEGLSIEKSSVRSYLKELKLKMSAHGGVREHVVPHGRGIRKKVGIKSNDKVIGRYSFLESPDII